MNEIVSTIMSIPGATFARKSKANFIAIPTGINDEGNPTYVKVAVSALLAKGNAKNEAFNFETAVAEYTDWAAKRAEKDAKPKTERKSGPDPEKQAAKEARMQALLNWYVNNPGEHTSKEVYDALVGEVYGEGTTAMTVGSDAKTLWERGEISRREEKGKKFYFFE
jgi:hypothetical protein